MSTQAQLLFLKAIPHLDRDGLITGHLSRLWAIIDPFHADILSQMGRFIQEWVDANLAIRYDTGHEPVLFFKGFRKNNANIRYDHEPASVYPPPSGWIRTEAGIIPDNEEALRLLIYSFDHRSSYRQVLLQYLPENANTTKNVTTMSRQPRDNVVRSSRHCRDENNTNLYDGDDVSYIPPSHPSSVNKRGSGGDLTPGFPSFPDHTLREAAWVYGELLYPGQWHGYHQYLLDLAPDGVVILLEWIKHFSDASKEELDEVQSLPKLIKWHIVRLNRPGLNLRQRKELIDMVADIARNPQPARWA